MDIMALAWIPLSTIFVPFSLCGKAFDFSGHEEITKYIKPAIHKRIS